MMAVSPCAPLPPRRLFLDFCRSVAVGHRVPAAPFPLFPLPSSLCPAISSCDVCALFPLPPSLCPAISSCDVCAYASRPPPPSLCAPLAPLCPPRPSFALFASSRPAIGPPCAICGGGTDSHDRCVFPCAPLPPRRPFFDFGRSVAVGCRVTAAPVPLPLLPFFPLPAIPLCDVYAVAPRVGGRASLPTLTY